jgi:hypothetical protein
LTLTSPNSGSGAVRILNNAQTTELFKVSDAGLVTLSAGINTGDGSATTPAYSFSSETGLGFYRAVANQISITRSAAEQFRLSVNGGASAETWYKQGTGNWSFGTNGATQLTLINGGKVTVNGATATYNLNVLGPAAIADFQSSGASALIYFTPTGFDRWRLGTGDINVNDFGIRNDTDGVTAVTIDGSEQVGINKTSSLGAQLHVLSGIASRVAALFDTAASPTADIAQFKNNGTIKLSIANDGDLTVGDQLIVSGSGPHAIGGATNADVALFFGSTFTAATNANGLYLGPTITVPANGFGTIFRSLGNLVEAVSGTHALMTGARLEPPIITDNVAVTTTSATLYVSDAPTVGTNKYAAYVAAGTSRFGGNILQDTVVFASLGTPANGTLQYCSDCTIANPCAGSGTGAFAKRLNGVWVCN